jgi:hypothetical protein
MVMIEVQLTSQGMTKPIVTFHANTLEYYFATSNSVGQSFHIGHIKSIEIITDRKGKNILVVATEHRTVKDEVDDRALDKLRELIAEVQKAIKSLSL